MSSGLDAILAVTDLPTRIQKLNDYIDGGEARIAAARKERVKSAMEMKEGGAAWAAVEQATGMTRQYIQREAAKP